jgi:hypothetical protein
MVFGQWVLQDKKLYGENQTKTFAIEKKVLYWRVILCPQVSCFAQRISGGGVRDSSGRRAARHAAARRPLLSLTPPAPSRIIRAQR